MRWTCLTVAGTALAVTLLGAPLAAQDAPGHERQLVVDRLEDELFSGLRGTTATSAASDRAAGDRAGSPAHTPGPLDPQLPRESVDGEDIGSSATERLTRVGESMRQVQRRIAQQDTSATTQMIQRQIIDQLDAMLNPLRQPGPAGESGQPTRQGDDSQAGQTGASGQASSRGPAADSMDRLGQTEPVVLPSNDREGLLRRAWGHLPAGLQQQLQSSLPETFLPEYSKLIEDYYRRLAEQVD